MFCYPENIAAQLNKLFGQLAAARLLRELDADEFAKAAAHFLAELNAVHPFREGNGRTQLTFLKLIAVAAGHNVEFSRLDAPAMLQAMIASFSGNEERIGAPHPATHVMNLVYTQPVTPLCALQ